MLNSGQKLSFGLGLVLLVFMGEGAIAQTSSIGITYQQSSRKYTSSQIALARSYAQELQQGIDFQVEGQFRQAIQSFETVLYYAQSVGDSRTESEVLNHLGNAYLRLGFYRQAIDFCISAQNIAEQIHDQNLQEITLNNLGNAYQAIGHTSLANEYHENYLASRVSRRFSGSRGALSYFSLGEYGKALYAYEDTLDLVRLSGNIEGEASTLRNIANVYVQLGICSLGQTRSKTYGCFQLNSSDYDYDLVNTNDVSRGINFRRVVGARSAPTTVDFVSP